MTPPPAMRLTCLGTSDAFGTGGRHCAGYLVETPGARILLDAGPSVLSGLARNDKQAEEIDAIVVSHLHGDHFGGIPFLLLKATFETPRTRPLAIVGPPDTESRIRELYRAYYRDASDEPTTFPLRFIEAQAARPFEFADLRIETFDVPHVRSGRSHGFRASAGGRSIVYSGDTEWTDDLLRHSRGADLFVCECTSFDGRVPGHVGWRQIEENRRRFECRDLLLTHLGREMRGRSAELPDRFADDGLVVAL